MMCPECKEGELVFLDGSIMQNPIWKCKVCEFETDNWRKLGLKVTKWVD